MWGVFPINFKTESRVDPSQMDSTSIGMLVALVIMIAMSAYFSATETAFTSINRIRLKNKADNGNKRAARTLELAEDYDKLLSYVAEVQDVIRELVPSVPTACPKNFNMISGGVVNAAYDCVGNLVPSAFFPAEYLEG